jgi:hypothetical protein
MSQSDEPNNPKSSGGIILYARIEIMVLITVVILVLLPLIARSCGIFGGEPEQAADTGQPAAAALEESSTIEAAPETDVPAPAAEGEQVAAATEATTAESAATTEGAAATDEALTGAEATEDSAEAAPTEETAAAAETEEAGTLATDEAAAGETIELSTAGLAANALSLEGTGHPGNTVEVYQDRDLLGQATIAEDGTWSFSQDLALAPGTYSLQLRELDAQGQTVAEVNRELVIREAAVSDIEVDQASLEQSKGLPAPTLAVTENPDVPGEIELSGQAEPDSEVQIVANGQVLDTVTTDSTGAWTYTTQLPVGDYEFVAVAASGLAAGLTSNNEALSVGDEEVAIAQATTEATGEATTEPTVEATAEATTEPTVEATVEPTAEATAEPTVETTAEPTVEATAESAQEPTTEPTQEATVEATAEATQEATVEPTTEPTQEPTVEATAEATQEATVQPTTEPTQEPTVEATAEPTAEATQEATVEATAEATQEATVEPTVEPTPEPPFIAKPQPVPVFKYRGPVAPRFYRPYFPPRYYWTPHHRYIPRCHCFIRPPWWRPHPPFRFYR